MERERHRVRVAVFLIFEDPQLLLMRRYNTGHRDGELGLPSGHVEKDETPEEALIREAEEEIRIKIPEDGLRLVHTQFNAESGTDREYMNLYFVAIRWSGVAQINEPGQCSELVWLERSPGQDWELPHDVIPYVGVALKAYTKSRHRRGGGGCSYSEVRY